MSNRNELLAGLPDRDLLCMAMYGAILSSLFKEHAVDSKIRIARAVG